jgi:SAM-dependent methyltransferase
LHFADPLPTQEVITGFYQGDYHSGLRTEGRAEKIFQAKYERYAAVIGRHLRRGRVVDVGCATGLLVRILKDRGYAAEGVELNPLSASWGREHYGVTIHDQPLDGCPYEPESLDALLLTDVLEHTHHPPDFLREAGRLLVPGGIVLVTFPGIRSLERRYFRAIARALPRLRGIRWWGCEIPYHVWEFTRPTAERCFETAGFRVVEFRRTQSPEGFPVGGRFLRLLLLPMRLLRWSPLQRWLGGQMEFVIQKISTGPPQGSRVV